MSIQNLIGLLENVQFKIKEASKLCCHYKMLDNSLQTLGQVILELEKLAEANGNSVPHEANKKTLPSTIKQTLLEVLQDPHDDDLLSRDSHD